MSPLFCLQLFWLGLALPGFALLWRLDRASLQGGVLAGLARSYLASFALLTPLSVLGYLLQLPLWTLSAAVLAAIVLALLWLAAEPSWLRRPGLPSASAAIGGTILLADLLLGAAAGAHLGGDAGYHVARIRLMLDLGLNSWDPLIDGARLDPVYHTNLYHALIAVSAQLSGADAGLAWLATWPVAKLLAAAGIYQLAFLVFGARWLAWVAAISGCVYYASYSVLPFPNTLAPVAFMPLGLAAGIEALCRPPSWKPAFWLAASSLLLAQTHALNALFLALVVGPLLALAVVWRALRRRPGKLQLMAAMFACGACLPWLVVPALPRIEAVLAAPRLQVSLGRSPAAATANAAAAASLKPESNASKRVRKADYFQRMPDGAYRLDPKQLLGPSQRHLPALYALGFALLLRGRRELWILAAYVATVTAWLSVPFLCTLLLMAVGAPWAVGRIGGVFAIAWCVLLPAGPLSIAAGLRLPFDAQRLGETSRAARWRERASSLHALRERVRRLRWPLRALLQAAALAAAAIYADWNAVKQAPWTREAYFSGAASLQTETRDLEIRARSRFFSSSIPTGATVMSRVRWDYNLPMHHRCHTLALSEGRGWHGVGDMSQRRGHTEEFFATDTSPERRLEILRKYRVQQVYTSRRFATQLIRGFGKRAVLRAGNKQGALVSVEL